MSAVLDRMIKKIFNLKVDDDGGKSLSEWLTLASQRELTDREVEAMTKRAFLEGVGPIRIREQLAEAEGVRRDLARLSAKPSPDREPSERDAELEKLWDDYSARMRALRQEGDALESEMNQRREARMQAFNRDLAERDEAKGRLRAVWRSNRERYPHLAELFVDPRPAGHPEAEVIEWVESK